MLKAAQGIGVHKSKNKQFRRVTGTTTNEAELRNVVGESMSSVAIENMKKAPLMTKKLKANPVRKPCINMIARIKPYTIKYEKLLP